MTTKRKTSLAYGVKVTLIMVSVFAIMFGIFCAFRIYVNNKTDGFNHGQITVTSCQEKDWAWRIYSCVGDYFSTGGGMVERQGVKVTAFLREYKAGDVIGDVYPPAFTTNQTTDHFVTGRERAGVTYNIPWLIGVFFALMMPLATAIILIQERRHAHKH